MKSKVALHEVRNLYAGKSSSNLRWDLRWDAGRAVQQQVQQQLLPVRQGRKCRPGAAGALRHADHQPLQRGHALAGILAAPQQLQQHRRSMCAANPSLQEISRC